MKETKVLKVFLKLVPYVVMIAVGLYLALLVTGAVMGLSQYKLTFMTHLQPPHAKSCPAPEAIL